MKALLLEREEIRMFSFYLDEWAFVVDFVFYLQLLYIYIVQLP